MSTTWVLFLLVALPLSFYDISSSSSITPDTALRNQDGSSMTPTIDVKSKENGRKDTRSTAEKEMGGDFNLEDYNPIDPSPTTKASVRPGPIQHGAPLNPYIPRPPSPDHPKNGG